MNSSTNRYCSTGFLIIGFFACVIRCASAQQTITYNNGDNSGTGIVITSGTNPTTLTISSGSATQSGTISESGTVAATIKAGAGSLTLTGTNTYSGGTTIVGGILQVASEAHLGGGSAGGITLGGGELLTTTTTSLFQGVTLNPGVNTLAAKTGTSATYNGVVSGLTGSVTVGDSSNAGTVVFTNSNTYVGGTTVSSGILQITTSTALGTGAVTVQSGATLRLDNGSSLDNAITISGTGSTTAPGAGGRNAGALYSYGGNTTITGTVTLAADASVGSFGPVYSGALNLNGNINLSGHTLSTEGDSVGYPRAETMIAGQISGSGGITVDGRSFTIFDGSVDNTYSGLTTVQEGAVLDLVNPGGVAIPGDLLIAGTFFVQSDSTGHLAATSVVTLTGTGQFYLDPYIHADCSVACAGLNGTSATTTVGSSSLVDGVDTLYLEGTGTYAYAGQIQNETAGGFGSAMTLVKQGTGTQVLSGNSNYSGGTTLAGGILQVGSSTSLGIGTISFSGGTLQYGAGVTQDFSSQFSNAAGQIYSIDTNGNNVSFGTALASGGGILTKLGGGTLTLTEFNSFTGITTVEGGTLALGAGSSVASSSGVNLAASGATFDISTGGNQTIKDLSGVAGSTVNLGANALTVGTANLTEFDGIIQGTGGSLVKQGTGTLILTGANTYSGGTTVSAGVLQGNTTSLQGDIVDNASLVFDQAGTGAYGGILSGTGSLTKQNSGQLMLTGANTYSGGTIINAGTLMIGNSIALGTGGLTVNAGTLDLNGYNVNVANLSGTGGTITSSTGTGTLTVNETMDPIFAGSITGPMAIVYNGTNASNLILTGNNTYTGGTTITGGTVVAGSTMAFGAGNLTLTGGTLMVGATPSGTLHVGGNYLQGSGGTLAFTISSDTVFNSLVVAGTAQLGGTLSVNFLGGYAPGAGQTFNLIEAGGGITGQFSSVVDNMPSLRFSLNGGSLSVQQLAFASFAQTPNQASVATYIDAHDIGAMTPGFSNLVGALNNASGNPQTLASAFDQLTPLKFANFTSSTSFNNASFSVQQLDGYLASHRATDGTFVSSAGGIDYSGLAINDPNIDTGLQSVRSRLLAWSPPPYLGLLSDTGDPVLGGIDMKDTKTLDPSVPADLWNVFAAGSVVLAQDFSNASAGIPYAHSTTGAAQIGVDFKVTPHFRAGGLFGYGHTHATLDTIGSNASVDTYSPGVYASYSGSGWFANALGSYGFSSYSQNRNVAIGAFNGTATSSPGGDQILGDFDGGYEFHRHKWTFGPTLGLQYVHLDVDGYTETGLSGADLTVSQNESDSLRSRLGGQVSYAIQSGSLIFTPHLSASWQHEFLDQSRGITSQFSDVGAGSFVVRTPNPSRESALADLGLDAQINGTCTLFTNYSIQAGQSNYFGQSVQAGLKIGF